MSSSASDSLKLGQGDNGDLEISLKTLQRHFGCFGSSGSGKTVMSKVLIEELARNGIPVIAFDPQGDISSLAMLADKDNLEKNGGDQTTRDDFAEKVEVVVWTPASSKGMPICINPLQFGNLDGSTSEDRTRYFSSVAINIASLVGYDLESDDGKSAEAVLSVLFEYEHSQNRFFNNFSDVVKVLQNLPDSISETLSAVASKKFINSLIKKLSLLTLGSRKLIFQNGVPANIDILLGRDESTKTVAEKKAAALIKKASEAKADSIEKAEIADRISSDAKALIQTEAETETDTYKKAFTKITQQAAAAADASEKANLIADAADKAAKKAEAEIIVATNKTRISVIYLNTLHSVEEKEFFIAGIAQLLYNWMLRHPLTDIQRGLQCAMFIDEVAPYIPPVKAPACKQSLELLFRQGRKYGVSCIIATQSPGDIDYKAIGQFSTFVLGTLNTKQDIEKVKRRLESVAPKEIDFITSKLPALKPGNFLAISPDEFETVHQMKTRWLVTEHRALSEENLDEIKPTGLQKFYNQSLAQNNTTEEVTTTDAQNNTTEEIISIDTQNKLSESDNQIQSTNNLADTKLSEETKEKKINSLSSRKTTKKQKTQLENVLVVKEFLKERNLDKNIRPHLSGRIIKSERLHQSKFKYLPLIKVDLTFIEEKGFIWKSQNKIPENLYLDYKTRELFYVEKKQFQFSQIVNSDPNKIEDLDDHCLMQESPRSEVDFRFGNLDKKKLNKAAIKKIMERKYQSEVNDIELVLFPIYECTIKTKKQNKTRKIYIDAIFGNLILGI